MNKNKRMYSLFMCIGLIVLGCDLSYRPSQMIQPGDENSTPLSGSMVTVYSVNGKSQTCNPSISQDSVNFKGCMLWLNFSGNLPAKVPSNIIGYDKNANQHDRLTISDTSDTVRWFLPVKEIEPRSEEFQDPEWSSHPEYIDFLVSSEYKTKWSCFAVHLLTKDTIRICNEKMNETSTPHLWVDKTSLHGKESIVNQQYDTTTGVVDRESIKKYFGTYNVKLAYALKENNALSLYYIDYSIGSKPVRLQKPQSKSQWDFESPLISPDGKWIVFNAYATTNYYESYIQELTPTSAPILLEENAADPHWALHPDDPSKLYLLYTTIPGTNLVLNDLSDTTLLKNGSAGQTFMQQLECYPGRSSLFSINKLGEPRCIVKLPLKGGLSPDGKFMCTGSDKAYLIRFH